MDKIVILNSLLQKYDAYSKALSWDMNLEENDNIEWVLGNMIAGYKDDELMLLGIINKNYKESNSVIFSIFKNPILKDKNMELKLFNNMLDYSKKYMNANKAYVASTRDNKDNITLILNIKKSK